MVIAECGNDVTANAVVVGVDKIEVQEGSAWVDRTGQTIYVDVGTTVSFRAQPIPSGASWPADCPVWSGDASGTTGTQVTLIFNTTGEKHVNAGPGAKTVTVNVIDVTFEETSVNSGFDATVNPHWLVVPVDNPARHNTVRAVINPPSLASAVYFTVDSTATATVTPLQPSSGNQILTVTGVGKGHATLRARLNSTTGTICETLNICARNKNVVTVDFHFMWDNSAHHTTRLTNSVDGYISAMNDIWTSQANVVFVKGSVTSTTLTTDLGTVVEWYSTNPQNEWDDISAWRSGAAPDIYFVWEYEQDGTPSTDNTDGAQLGGDILLEDDAGAEVGETLAHEMGHYFGINPADYQDHQEQLMHAYTDVRGRKITHAQVEQVPQP